MQILFKVNVFTWRNMFSVLTVPATDIAEETVISEEPPVKRQCIEIVENRVESAEIEVRSILHDLCWTVFRTEYQVVVFVLFRRLISVLPQNEVCETLTCSVSPVTEIYLLQSCCKKKIGGLFAWSFGHGCKSDTLSIWEHFFCSSLKVTSCFLKLGADMLSSDLTLSTRSEWEHCTLIFLLQPHASDCEIIFTGVSFPFVVSR